MLGDVFKKYKREQEHNLVVMFSNSYTLLKIEGMNLREVGTHTY